MINKFLSGLSTNEKRILSIASLFVLLALFDRLLVAPSLGRIKEIDEAIVKEEGTIQQDMKFLAYKDRVVKESSALKDYYTKDVRTEEEVIADFLKKMESMATQSKVELSKITPAGQDYKAEYVKYFATLDCSGSLENVMNFIYTVNTSKELLKVEKMGLGSNARSVETVVANLTISKMIVGEDPAVDPKSLVKVPKDKETAAPPETAPKAQ
ncbi:MAG: hypothetical protein HQL19_03450 [Candidatus Omnitrophica bacterium]|nr:hypothetical protein [Candidatus Omnitrophota bacterium]